MQDRPGSSKTAPLQPTVAVRGAEGSGQRAILIMIAFLAGAAVMIMELAANRILAPCFGNTLYTWTGLIGVILIALSGGYYAGGWLADFRCDYKTLSQLLAVSAGAVFLIPLSHRLAAAYFQNFDPRLGPVLASTWLFALPGILLGALSPYIIRLVSLLSHDRHIGLSAGTIFMFSTLGSVIGTFGAGFFLIPHLQLDRIFVIIGVVLLAVSAAVSLFLARGSGRRCFLSLGLINLVLVILAAGAALPEDAAVLYDKNNFYHRIRVFQKEAVTGDRMISLYLDTTFQGARYEHSDEIPSRYQRFWALSRIFCPHLKRAAFLGGGAMVMPEDMLKSDPSLQVDVIEIDPQLFEVGRRFFRVDEYPQLNLIAADARRYLRLTDRKYDLIFGDVYHGVHHVPPHLVTQEFFRLVKDRLNAGGVFMMNLIGTVQGRQALLFQSTLHTINSVFKQCYVFATHPDNLEQLQNIIIVALEVDTPHGIAEPPEAVQDPLVKPLLAHYLGKEKYTLAGAYLITDDRNPLEYLTAKSIAEINR